MDARRHERHTDLPDLTAFARGSISWHYGGDFEEGGPADLSVESESTGLHWQPSARLEIEPSVGWWPGINPDKEGSLITKSSNEN